MTSTDYVILPSPTSFGCVILRLDAVLNARMNGAQEVRCLSDELVGLAHRTGLRGKEWRGRGRGDDQLDGLVTRWSRILIRDLKSKLRCCRYLFLCKCDQCRQ